jgi:hypothetical protein
MITISSRFYNLLELQTLAHHLALLGHKWVTVIQYFRCQNLRCFVQNPVTEMNIDVRHQAFDDLLQTVSN